jgi:hypothetical protein
MTTASNIVPLRPQQLKQPCLPTTPRRKTEFWSESWAEEPTITLPDIPDEIVDALPDAIEQARRDLSPGDPVEVLRALTTLASRKNLPAPDDLALEMDVEVMAAWPRDLWRQAFRSIWEDFAYRRFPEVGDFKQVIAGDLAERQARLHRLELLRLKLDTVRLKRQWDEDSRARRSRGG